MRWILGFALLLVPVACAQAEDADGGSQSSNPSSNPNGASCVGSCGQKSPDESCWCDTECATIGDCCADLNQVCSFPDAGKPPSSAGGSGGTSAGGGGSSSGGLGGSSFGGSSFGGTGSGGLPNTGGPSCVGLCGGSAAGEACWCEPSCVQYGDCCPDFAQACGGGGGSGSGGAPAGGGCTTQLCNSETPSSENGMECYCDQACQQYGDCCSNAVQVCGGG